jgi:probable F420-dependent oxidoreductase
MPIGGRAALLAGKTAQFAGAGKPMRFGVVYPQTEYPTEAGAVREYARAAEALGYRHILAYDHVLGANPDRPGGWRGPYTYRSAFLEPFLLFSFMADATTAIEFAPSVIILPQRQTALVAKQAATLDVLSGGRLRLGVGLGWNAVEYAALGQDFHRRGRRIEEQVALLRELWTKELVTFRGRWDAVEDAGLRPMPIQRPIPLWFGGSAEQVLGRVARLGDGWMINQRHSADARPLLEKLDRLLAEAGRSRADIGLEARVLYGDGDSAIWDRQMAQWRELGVTHLALNTMGSGLATADEHLAAIERFARHLDLTNDI